MAAGKYDIVIEQGADFLLTLTWRDQNYNPINLTAYTARMKVKETKDSTTTLISLTSSSGIILGGALGTIAIAITAANTATYTFETAVYDLELIDGSGVVTRLLEGSCTLSREVTTT